MTFSDEIYMKTRNIIEIYFRYLPFSEYYSNEIIQMLACSHYINAKCLGLDDFTKEIALIWAKNDIDSRMFKRNNCKCDSSDFCVLCWKFNKNIEDFKRELDIKNNVFDILDNIYIKLKKFIFNYEEITNDIVTFLNTAIITAKDNNICIQDRLQNIYVLLYSDTKNIDFLIETKKILEKNLGSLEESIKIVKENQNRFATMILTNLGKCGYKNKLIEKEIQKRLCKELKNAKIEVETPCGFIDILTDNEIIEIKNGKNWKHAVGQILVYSKFYPKHKKRLHLFNTVNDELINDFCRKNNISVSYETENIIKDKIDVSANKSYDIKNNSDNKNFTNEEEEDEEEDDEDEENNVVEEEEDEDDDEDDDEEEDEDDEDDEEI